MEEDYYTEWDESRDMTFNDIMIAIQGINENKAVKGNLKSMLIRLGRGRTEEVLFRIIK